jgi:hypothetical protein
VLGDERGNVPVEGVCSHALSYDGEDHSELVRNEALAPQVVPGIEHVAVLESGEPDAVQVKTPDHHLEVESEVGRRGRKRRTTGEGEWVTADTDRSNRTLSTGHGRWVIMSAAGVTLLRSRETIGDLAKGGSDRGELLPFMGIGSAASESSTLTCPGVSSANGFVFALQISAVQR